MFNNKLWQKLIKILKNYKNLVNYVKHIKLSNNHQLDLILDQNHLKIKIYFLETIIEC